MIVGQCKAALVQVLATATAGTATQVIYGKRAAVTETLDRVVVVGDARGDTTFRNLAAGRLDFDFTIDVTVSVTINGPDSMQAAAEAALDLWASCVAAVRATDTAGWGVVGVDSGQPLGGFELVEAPTDAGRNAAVLFAVRFRANS